MSNVQSRLLQWQPRPPSPKTITYFHTRTTQILQDHTKECQRLTCYKNRLSWESLCTKSQAMHNYLCSILITNGDGRRSIMEEHKSALWVGTSCLHTKKHTRTHTPRNSRPFLHPLLVITLSLLEITYDSLRSVFLLGCWTRHTLLPHIKHTTKKILNIKT